MLTVEESSLVYETQEDLGGEGMFLASEKC